MIQEHEYETVVDALRVAAVFYYDRAYNIRCASRDQESQTRAQKYEDKSTQLSKMAQREETALKGRKVQEAECSVGIREVAGSIPAASSNLKSLEEHVYPQQRLPR